MNKELLINQLGNEMGNAIFYKRIAAHYAGLNYNGFKKYFSDAGDEEMEHFQKIFDYLDKKQIPFIPPMPVDRPLPKDMTDIGIAEAKLSLEQGTTAEWYAIYESAKGKYGITPKNGKQIFGELEKCDPSVMETIATEFINIQDAEEQESHDYIAKLNMCTNILLIDKELQNV
jgi:ferritin-like protein